VIKKSIAKSNSVIANPKKSETTPNTILKPESSEKFEKNETTVSNS